MNWRDYIEENPRVMMGKPVFKGTRLTVEHVLQRLADGSPIPDLLDAHPNLKEEHIQAALCFAAERLRK